MEMIENKSNPLMSVFAEFLVMVKIMFYDTGFLRVSTKLFLKRITSLRSNH